jgi:hypothetical protein
MCVIVYKPSNVDVGKLLDKKMLQQCWDANDDGAGLAWFDTTARLWEIRKGFMSFHKFWKHLKEAPLTTEATAICHFRIGTSGKMDGGNTHPFPITSDIEHMRKTSISGVESLLFHNGVVGKGEGDLSDTMVFIRDMLDPLIPLLGTDDRIAGIIQELSTKGASRWILAKGESVWRFGTSWAEEKELFFSNTSWKYKTTYTHSVGAAWTGHYHGGATRTDVHQGYVNEFGRYVNGVWKPWSNREKRKMKRGVLPSVTPDAKESHTTEVIGTLPDKAIPKALYLIIGEDGSARYSPDSSKYWMNEGLGIIVCPNCYEDKRLVDNTIPELAATSTCLECGACFDHSSGAIVGSDIYAKRYHNTNHVVIDVGKCQKTATGIIKMTPEERQLIIDAQTEDMLRTGLL